uniref:SpaN n=1 Tax=Spirochaeta aurantia TaxID=147 RepID=Q0PHZ2_SPIAU|nr:SpaN [Spirochaeta aurantia]
MMKLFFAILRLMRPKEYIKNLLVFLPMFFAMRLNEVDLWVQSSVAFLGFCLISSSIYVINDLKDVEADRIHPVKKHRPIASGAVPVTIAWVVFSVLVLAAFAVSLSTSLPFFVLQLAYFVLNLLYTWKLKTVAIVDICILSAGFLLRLFVGSAVTSIPLSGWIILVLFFLTLLLGAGKRRDDLLLLEAGLDTKRASVRGYSLEMLNVLTTVVGTAGLVCYIIYTMTPEVMARFQSEHLYLTAFPVVAGVLRYFQIMLVEKRTGSPTELFLKDAGMASMVILWAVSFCGIVLMRY